MCLRLRGRLSVGDTVRGAATVATQHASAPKMRRPEPWSIAMSKITLIAKFTAVEGKVDEVVDRVHHAG